MTRVLQVMAGAHHGGAETYFVDLVTALHRAGLDQKAVIRTDRERADRLREAGIEPVELPFGGPLDMVTGRRLRRVIADYNPDIVQSWMNRATRFVPHPKGERRFVHIGWFGGYYKLANYRACDHLVGVTTDIRSHQIAGGWPGERAHYIPTFAHTETAEPVPRGQFGTPEGAPLFLALGRLHEKKAFDVLIRAIAGVPEAHLWIAGDGPLDRALKDLTGDLGLSERVRFLGWRDDRAALFAAADFCVMPSRYEPFGTVMIEAWGQGVPLIAAAAAGPKSLIKDGENGLLVAVDDVAALTCAMERLINDAALSAQITETARAEFGRHFTEGAVASRYLELFRSVVQS